MDSLTLVETLQLERIEINLFRGTTPEPASGRIYGGQVIAQSLLAAYQTVGDRVCHSLHCYFIRPGDPEVPIIFEVDRARDGGSFTTRRVVAVQHGRQIFNLAASFMAPEAGFEHQSPAPEAPPPEDLPDETDRLKGVPLEQQPWFVRASPIEIRRIDPLHIEPDPPREEPHQRLWFRARDPIGHQPHLHQVILAYASDMTLLSTAVRPHGVNWRTPNYQSASLDHAMWFHRPVDFDDWHLYVQESPSAAGGRGFIRGLIYARDGRLVASAAQEALIRIREP